MKRYPYLRSQILPLVAAALLSIVIAWFYVLATPAPDSTALPISTPVLLEDMPGNNDQSILNKTLPAHVEGIIVSPLYRIDPVWHRNDQGDIVSIEPAVYRLLLRVNGSDDVYPVTIETFHAIWWMETTVRLDCRALPCILEK